MVFCVPSANVSGQGWQVEEKVKPRREGGSMDAGQEGRRVEGESKTEGVAEGVKLQLTLQQQWWTQSSLELSDQSEIDVSQCHKKSKEQEGRIWEKGRGTAQGGKGANDQYQQSG